MLNSSSSGLNEKKSLGKVFNIFLGPYIMTIIAIMIKMINALMKRHISAGLRYAIRSTDQAADTGLLTGYQTCDSFLFFQNKR